MATRGRPNKSATSDRMTIIFNDNETIIIERIRKLAMDNNKSVSEIVRNILKIGMDCYDLGFNIGFDGKLIKSEKVIEDKLIEKKDETAVVIKEVEQKKESLFIE